MEEKIIALETKLAFQEHTVNELNDIITDQQAQIDRLREELEIVSLRLESVTESGSNPDEPEPPPPHY